MNNPTTYSVGDARAAFADILNRVAYSGETVTIVKHGEPVARITPVVPKISDDIINKHFGIWKNEVWVKKIGKPSRRFRRRKIFSL